MDKVLLVTGGSRGIGAATAIAAARAGWAVLVNYASSRERAEEVVATIRSSGGTAEAVGADVSREDEVARMFEACRERFGRLDGLVNNAGVLRPASRLEDMDLSRWEEVFGINVTGTFLCSRAAIRMMSHRHGGAGGAIVNLSSMAAVFGGGNEFIDYGASKGAIDVFTVGLSRELAAEGIRVNAVRPGLIDTEIHSGAGDPDRLARLGGTVPMKRVGSAGEVADAILWLLSDAASYVTGAIVPVTGGR